MFPWIRHFVTEVCTPSSALLVYFDSFSIAVEDNVFLATPMRCLFVPNLSNLLINQLIFNLPALLSFSHLLVHICWFFFVCFRFFFCLFCSHWGCTRCSFDFRCDVLFSYLSLENLPGGLRKPFLAYRLRVCIFPVLCQPDSYQAVDFGWDPSGRYLPLAGTSLGCIDVCKTFCG